MKYTVWRTSQLTITHHLYVIVHLSAVRSYDIAEGLIDSLSLNRRIFSQTRLISQTHSVNIRR